MAPGAGSAYAESTFYAYGTPYGVSNSLWNVVDASPGIDRDGSEKIPYSLGYGQLQGSWDSHGSVNWGHLSDILLHGAGHAWMNFAAPINRAAT